MSHSIFSKIGRALSIFGVSSPADIRRMEQRNVPRNKPERRPETGAECSPIPSDQPSIQLNPNKTHSSS